MDDWTPDPKWDAGPANRPYPDSMPDFDTKPANPTDRDVHLVALHQFDRIAHEAAVLVDSGDLTQLHELKRAIKANVALRQELGTTVVTPSPQSQRYLDMEGPSNATA
jgi:hypothetical protein